MREFNRLGYSVDVLTLDARRFVPQSRSRLFVVAAQDPPGDDARVSELRPGWLGAPYADPALVTHRAVLPAPPPLLTEGMSSLMEQIGADDGRSWDEKRCRAFTESLSPVQSRRLEDLRVRDTASYRTAYRRARQGTAVWEIRADDVAGCLRTAGGGSSRQALVQAGQGSVRVRWMIPREYAALMGAPDYTLEGLRDSQARDGFGDAVCVPVVSWLAEHYLLRLAQAHCEPVALGSTLLTSYVPPRR